MDSAENKNRPSTWSLIGATRMALWGVAIGASLWLYYYPVDHFKVTDRSEPRVPFIAESQADREEEIATRVKQLVDEIRQLWKNNFPDEPMADLNPPATE